MTMMRKILIACGAALALAACGKVGDLQPKAGQAMPAKAYGQTEASTAEQLSTPSVQARPGRSDELMRRSERRREDPFDLPPGEEPEKVAPPPVAPAENSEEKPG
jgi:hypothetical protein